MRKMFVEGGRVRSSTRKFNDVILKTGISWENFYEMTMKTKKNFKITFKLRNMFFVVTTKNLRLIV